MMSQASAMAASMAPTGQARRAALALSERSRPCSSPVRRTSKRPPGVVTVSPAVSVRGVAGAGSCWIRVISQGEPGAPTSSAPCSRATTRLPRVICSVSPGESAPARRDRFKGGCAPAAVSRHEAELLFRLKDATLADENAPEWDDLFIDGVANFMKGFVLPSAQLSHERKRELEAFVADNQVNLGRFLGRVVREVPHVGNHFGKVFGKKKPAGADYEALAAEGEKVTAFESEWLDSMIAADGETDALETRLIARLAEQD